MPAAIRFACPDDAEAILSIYAPYVVSSPVTFEATVPRVYDFKRRIAATSASLPFLVCVADGKIAGFAYAVNQKFGTAFSQNICLYVYISNEYQRCNIASALYLALLSLLKAQEYRRVLAFVTSSNQVCEAFHSAFGFEKVGTLKKAGYKLGKWHSVSIFEKSLSDSDAPPVPPKSISELDPAFCERNFKKCAKIIRLR